LININLAPIDEQESPYWYLPELAMFILSVGISWFAVQSYLEGIQVNVARYEIEVASKNAAYQVITRETARYNQLDKDIEKLNEKLNSLQKITISKIARFRPVIILEHLQNLKPEGIWFNYISDNSEAKTMTVVAKSFDSILVAEFMSALEATKTQEIDESDLRTQVYFDKTRLERVATTGFAANAGGRARGGVRSRSQLASRDSTMKAEAAGGFWGSGDTEFPELKKFPAFQLTLSYKERVPKDTELGLLQ